MHITDKNETVLLVIKFRVRGSLRFLSHAEMLRVFQRACVRAGIDLQYSKGFNPRPKMSLPLPRPVGVESDDELLCFRIYKNSKSEESNTDELCSSVRDKLSAQLPEGCELLSVKVAQISKSYQPLSAVYVFAVKSEYINDELKAAVTRLQDSKNLYIQRKTGAKRLRTKKLDVRPFLKSIKADDRGIIVECNISPAGSIRIDEILGLLKLDAGKLALPTRRTSVKWHGEKT